MTAEIIADAVGVEPKIEEALGLTGSVRAVAELLGALADEHDSIMIVGHNPTLSDLVEHLTGRESPCLHWGTGVTVEHPGWDPWGGDVDGTGAP